MKIITMHLVFLKFIWVENKIFSDLIHVHKMAIFAPLGSEPLTQGPQIT